MPSLEYLGWWVKDLLWYADCPYMCTYVCRVTEGRASVVGLPSSATNLLVSTPLLKTTTSLSSLHTPRNSSFRFVTM